MMMLMVMTTKVDRRTGTPLEIRDEMNWIIVFTNDGQNRFVARPFDRACLHCFLPHNIDFVTRAFVPITCERDCGRLGD